MGPAGVASGDHGDGTRTQLLHLGHLGLGIVVWTILGPLLARVGQEGHIPATRAIVFRVS